MLKMGRCIRTYKRVGRSIKAATKAAKKKVRANRKTDAKNALG